MRDGRRQTADTSPLGYEHYPIAIDNRGHGEIETVDVEAQLEIVRIGPPSRSQTAGSLPLGCSLPRMTWVGTVAGDQVGDQVGARLVLVCGGDTVPARYNQRHFPSTGQRSSGG